MEQNSHKQRGTTEAVQLPTEETESIYAPRRVVLGYWYGRGGPVVKGEIGREGAANQKAILDYLDGESRQKAKIGALKGKPCQDGQTGCQRGRGNRALDYLAKRRNVKAPTCSAEDRTCKV